MGAPQSLFVRHAFGVKWTRIFRSGRLSSTMPLYLLSADFFAGSDPEAAMDHESLKYCDLCGGDSWDTLFVKEGFRHVRCRGCGLVFVNPRMANHLDVQQSSGTGSMGDDTLTESQTRRYLKELSRLEPYRSLNRILEIGAGRGWFLQEATNLGWETWAVEINADALRRLETRNINRIVMKPAEEFDTNGVSVDVAKMWDVIEHLRSPRRAVANVHAALRPGGLFSLATTNFASLSLRLNGPEWVYLNGADHIFLFEPSTISRLLSEIGFSQIRIRTRSFNMRRKLYHPEKDLPGGPLILRPFRKLIDECIRFTMYGHQMIVTAIKNR
jgi:2-polyprenyl-3-methyl-5-hydroxy-6-metoxy-1,4-benzoquinol methylase